MNENLSFAEDLLFNLEYLDAVRLQDICIINAANYIYYDTDPVSLSHKYREDLEDINMIVIKKLEYYKDKWGLDDSVSVLKYYSIVYFRFVDIMHNTFLKENKMSYLKKIRHNNSILKSEVFNNALSHINIPSRLRKVYKTHNYFWVRVYERVVYVYGKINI